MFNSFELTFQIKLLFLANIFCPLFKIFVEKLNFPSKSSNILHFHQILT